MRPKTIYFLIVFHLTITLTITCVVMKAYGNNMQITKDKAIEIANNEAKRLGYNVESMTVKATHYNTPWNDYLSKDSEEEYDVERRNKLKNKEYWAVYCYNPKYKKGGDLCIFIDSSNGSVITYIRGK